MGNTFVAVMGKTNEKEKNESEKKYETN